MVGCSAKNCMNRTEKGFRMFRFPTNVERRQIWSERCLNTPSQNSRLCEYHFDDSQYESHRQDGWRKLKTNALPTIFNYTENNHIADIIAANQPSISKVVKQKSIANNEIHRANDFTTTIYSRDNVIDAANTQHESLQSVSNIIDTGSQINEEMVLQTKYSSNENSKITQTNELKYLRNKVCWYQKKIHILRSDKRYLRSKLTQSIKVSKKWKTKHAELTKKFEEIPFLKKFISGLINPKAKWSEECLKIAIQIRYAVGWKTYLYLRKDLGLPLPSYSTLCRHISQLDFSPDMLVEVIALMKKKRISHTSSHQSKCVLLMDELENKTSLEC